MIPRRRPLRNNILSCLVFVACPFLFGSLVSVPARAGDGDLGTAKEDPRNPIRQLFEGDRLDLWSLEPIVRPQLDDAASAWASGPIDRLLERVWSDQGLRPSPPLDRRRLIQRLSLDLLGLRATEDEVQAFEQDESPDAYERIVDRMLASPEYGEHWARQWLDVVRYSDSNGFDWDELRKEAWRYRDFVVRAWNQDLPYDQFVTMQLAGDELLDGPPRDAREQDCLIATGYLRLGPYDNAAKLFNEQDRARVEVLTDLTETTASAFLGLTMACCRCHDHKTDPLSQVDHYRMRAFFAATRFADEDPIDLQSTLNAIAEHNAVLERRIEAHERKLGSLRESAKDRIRNPSGHAPSSEDGTQQTLQVTRSQSSDIKDEQCKEALTETERQEWDASIQAIADARGALRHPQKGLIAKDDADDIDPIYVLFQGDHRSPRDRVEPGFPSALFPNAPQWLPPKKPRSTGRRLALAQWILREDNPWTARVIVNRLWQGHFGEGLVATPNDFGITGEPPKPRDVLDYLAIELKESGWSLKSIQREIVLSQAYRQQTVPGGIASGEPASSSPANERWVSVRHRMKRLSAEQYRDVLLQTSSQLIRRTGGPPVWPRLSDDVLQANPAVLDDNETKTKGWYPSPDSDQNVRSIYLIQKRTLRLPWMETFDLPENTVSCPKREMSIVPPQALSMLNGELATRAAEAVVTKLQVDGAKRANDSDRPSRLDDPAPPSDRFVDDVFRLILARSPSAREREQCEAFLKNRTREELALVLLNCNELAFVP